MSEKMICPLLVANGQKENERQLTYCVREQCNWWIGDRNKCAIACLGQKR